MKKKKPREGESAQAFRAYNNRIAHQRRAVPKRALSREAVVELADEELLAAFDLVKGRNPNAVITSIERVGGKIAVKLRPLESHVKGASPIAAASLHGAARKRMRLDVARFEGFAVRGQEPRTILPELAARGFFPRVKG